MRRGVLFASLALVVLLVAGMAGCKNVCQRAAEHYFDCWETYCAENQDDERCEIALANAAMEALLEAERCPAEEQMEELLDKSCSQIVAPEEP